MKKKIGLILILVGICLAPVPTEKVESFAERKGRVKTRPIHMPMEIQSTHEDGVKGTWGYYYNATTGAAYEYVWVNDTTVLRTTLSSFGVSRLKTVENDLEYLQTVDGNDLRTTELHFP